MPAIKIQQLLKENHEHHLEVLKMKIELKRVQDELQEYQNFYQFGEREVLMEEICSLRNQLHFYVDSSSTAATKQYPPLQLTYSSEPSLEANLTAIPDLTEASTKANANPESTEDSAKVKLEQEKSQWTEAESRWISLTEKLRAELETSRLLAEKRKQELDTERKCAEELNETMQMAIEGHARILEQYADLEEKHIQLLDRHRKIQDGIDDVKEAASRAAGVRGADSKFINALAAEISALKAEKEKEMEILRDENRGLRAQLKDTAEAVQAAGELLVRLNEAEEGVITAQVCKESMWIFKFQLSKNQCIFSIVSPTLIAFISIPPPFSLPTLLQYCPSFISKNLFLIKYTHCFSYSHS